MLMYAASVNSKKHVSILRQLLKQPSVDVNLADNAGWTALHVATYNGNIEAARLLLADPRVDVNSQDAQHLAVLTYAARECSENHLSILRLLLEHPSIDVNLACNEGVNALYLAVSKGNIEAVKVLLADQRVDVNCRDKNQNTPLTIAAQKPDNIDIFKLLLAEQRVDVNWVGVASHHGDMTALMLASWNSNVEATKLLLDDPRVDVNWVDSSGRTVLLRLVASPCAKSNLQVLELFLAHPRVDVNFKCGPPLPPTILFGTVAFCNDVEVVKLILAEPRFTSANVADEMNGFTAVSVAMAEGKWGVLKELVHHPSIDLDLKDKNGRGLDDLVR